MRVVEAYFKTHSQAAMCAVRAHDDAEPRMVEPYMGRVWAVELPYPGEDRYDALLSVVYFFDGVARVVDRPDLGEHFGARNS